MTEAQIAALNLDSGAHSDPQSGHCLLEVVSMMAGEPFGDSPQCVDPVLAAFGRSWNDRLGDVERQSLKQYVPMLVGTYKGPALQIKRAFMALDWLWRVHAPLWLEQVPGLAEHAATLRALAPITSELGEAERKDALDKAAAAARAAWAARAARAAWAAWDAWAARAAWDAWAARAAWDAWDAWDAAASAAQTAAYEAAKGCASYEEARSKADAVFMAHRDAVQAELHDLYLRMINARLQDAAEADRAQAADATQGASQ
jgi:hypothetical protein